MGTLEDVLRGEAMTHRDQEAEGCEPAFAGMFESHVTVELADADALGRFREACAELGVKCILIELPRGVTRSQPMTSRVHRGTLDQARREAMELAGALSARGFPALRVKIEAAPDNRDIPETDEQASRLAPGHYFEYHVRLTLPGGEATDRVRAACQPHGAHVSANALRQLAGGQSERFVTLRCHGVGRATAEARMAALRGSLEGTGYPLGPTVREYCVLDSNLALDDGWLEP